MEMDKKMEVVTKEALLQAPPADYHALDPDLIGCCPCCGCCGCCDCCSLPDCCSCDSCPSCKSCPGCGSCPGCCCCPSCCCPPSCSCCCRLCCSLPRLLCRLPKFPSCPVHVRRLLIIVVVVVLIVVVIVGALLMGVFIIQAHSETVLQMSLDGLEGEQSQLNFPLEMEDVATFHVEDGISGPAMVIYDFNKLLIGYKPWQGHSCYVARMDKENIQGLDTIVKEFQTKSSITPPTQRGEEKQEPEEVFLPSLVDRSILGTTINVLCSHVPIFWA